MKYKATTSFAGEISMFPGEEKEIDENIATPLLQCGYIEPVQSFLQSNAKTELESEVFSEDNFKNSTGATENKDVDPAEPPIEDTPSLKEDEKTKNSKKESK